MLNVFFIKDYTGMRVSRKYYEPNFGKGAVSNKVQKIVKFVYLNKSQAWYPLYNRVTFKIEDHNFQKPYRV